jgi:hypothetical protein
LNPVSVRAAISGETLSAPSLSSLVEAPDELDAPEEERAGRTAEADIPEFLEMAGGTTFERYGVLPQNPPPWSARHSESALVARSLVFSPFVQPSNVGE